MHWYWYVSLFAYETSCMCRITFAKKRRRRREKINLIQRGIDMFRFHLLWLVRVDYYFAGYIGHEAIILQAMKCVKVHANRHIFRHTLMKCEWTFCRCCCCLACFVSCSLMLFRNRIDIKHVFNCFACFRNCESRLSLKCHWYYFWCFGYLYYIISM